MRSFEEKKTINTQHTFENILFLFYQDAMQQHHRVIGRIERFSLDLNPYVYVRIHTQLMHRCRDHFPMVNLWICHSHDNRKEEDLYYKFDRVNAHFVNSKWHSKSLSNCSFFCCCLPMSDISGISMEKNQCLTFVCSIHLFN